MCAEEHVVHVRPLGPLTFVFHHEVECPGTYSAHCLELDIGGSGKDRREALRDVQDAVETFVLHHYENGEDVPLRAAPSDLLEVLDRKVFHLLLVWSTNKSEASFHEVAFTDPPPAVFNPENLAPAGS